MNKSQLIIQVARQARIPKPIARKVVNACIAAITSSARSRSGVTITGFGRFWCQESAGCRIFNPRTQRSVWRRGEKVVLFSPAGW